MFGDRFFAAAYYGNAYWGPAAVAAAATPEQGHTFFATLITLMTRGMR